MTKEELTKGLSYLGMAYGKEYSSIECEQHYDFLREYNYQTFVEAVKSIIRKSKFLPKITELLEECEKYKEHTKFEVLEFMKSKGYFKATSEYEKAIKYLETNVIPEWFRNDLNEHYRMMQQVKLEHKETLLIGG